mgnify:CR=1 FL=1
MKINPLQAILLLILKPRAFETLAVEHAAWLSQESQPKVNKQVEDSRTVRRSLSISLLLVTAAVLIGWLTGSILVTYVGPPSRGTDRVLQVVGVAIVLWATLAKQGWNIQSYNGNTLPELVDRWIYRALYVIGSYIVVLAVSWSL